MLVGFRQLLDIYDYNASISAANTINPILAFPKRIALGSVPNILQYCLYHAERRQVKQLQ